MSSLAIFKCVDIFTNICVIFIPSQIILLTNIYPYLKYLVHQMLPMPKYKNHMRVDYACSREHHGSI